MKNKETKKNFFNKIEKLENKIIYHTKIFSMINNFEAKPKKGKFWLCLRNIFNNKKYESFHLFSVKENDKFLGIFYGFKNLPRPFVINYSEKGTKKTIRLKKIFYMEFKFKKGSVFCYLRSLYIFTKIKNKNKLFYKSLLERTLKIEEEIHKFYGKKYESNKGIVNWIKKHKIITIASIKGGVGKSTTSLMFTNILSKNNKILLIDLDPQASSTSFYINILRKKP